jgi:hypothetical protein
MERVTAHYQYFSHVDPHFGGVDGGSSIPGRSTLLVTTCYVYVSEAMARAEHTHVSTIVDPNWPKCRQKSNA